jgi:hypothetical protein
VEELYFQAESLESAHLALEIERRTYQELFEGGPDGYMVTDPESMILCANRASGAIRPPNGSDRASPPPAHPSRWH